MTEPEHIECGSCPAWVINTTVAHEHRWVLRDGAWVCRECLNPEPSRVFECDCCGQIFTGTASEAAEEGWTINEHARLCGCHR